MAKAIALLALLVIGIAATVAVMIHGWGLTPKSWWWIIGGILFIRGVAAVSKEIAEEKEEKK